MLANEGTDTLLIQAHLGHRDIRNTTRYTALSAKAGGTYEQLNIFGWPTGILAAGSGRVLALEGIRPEPG
jgi:hypothetical protein